MESGERSVNANGTSVSSAVGGVRSIVGVGGGVGLRLVSLHS